MIENNSKLRFCKNRKCTFNEFYHCALKEIYLNEKGECMQYKPSEAVHAGNVTIREIREWFDGYGKDEYRPRCPMRSGPYNERMRAAIVPLIEHGPQAYAWRDEAFVEKWAKKFSHTDRGFEYYPGLGYIKNLLKEMLKDIGRTEYYYERDI